MFRYSLELKRGPRRRGGVKLIKSRSSGPVPPAVRKRNHASRGHGSSSGFGRGISGYTLTTSADESVVRTREPSAGGVEHRRR